MKEFKNYVSLLSDIANNISFDNVQKLYEYLDNSFEKNNKIIIVGNGGSSSIASHAVADLAKLRKDDNSLNVLTLNDNTPILTAYSNDYGYEKALTEIIKNYNLNDEDIVIIISSSGKSKNLINLINFCNEKKAVTFVLTGFKNSDISKISNYSIDLNINKDYYGPAEDIHMMVFHIYSHLLKNNIAELN